MRPYVQPDDGRRPPIPFPQPPIVGWVFGGISPPPTFIYHTSPYHQQHYHHHPFHTVPGPHLGTYSPHFPAYTQPQQQNQSFNNYDEEFPRLDPESFDHEGNFHGVQVKRLKARKKIHDNTDFRNDFFKSQVAAMEALRSLPEVNFGEKGSVSLSPNGIVDFGCLSPECAATTRRIQLSNFMRSQVSVFCVRGVPSLKGFTLEDDEGWILQQDQLQVREITSTVVLSPGTTWTFNANFEGTDNGGWRSTVFFLVDTDAGRCVLSLKLVASVIPEEDRKALNPEADVFVPKALKELFDKPADSLLFGKPPARCPISLTVPHSSTLDNVDFFVDGDELVSSLTSGNERLSRSSEPVVKARQTLRRNMMKALKLEDEKMQEDLPHFDLFNFPVKQQSQGLCWLRVPGLLEKRPLVQYGDEVRLRVALSMGVHAQSEALPTVEYVAYVHAIKRNDVLLSVNTRLNPTFLYHARFTYNRGVFLEMADAVIDIYGIDGYCRLDWWQEPQEDESHEGEDGASVEKCTVDFLNKEQLEAANGISGGRVTGFPPIIVHGPPGTGKTSVVVESTKLIVRDPEKRVLVSAPSNIAADIIVQRLSPTLSPSQLLRLNRDQRDVATVRAEALPYSPGQPFPFLCPELDALKKYQVIVCTCATANVLRAAGLPRGHFDHIIIDEAGQALLTESLLPMWFATPSTAIALVGDHKQLGPIVRSPGARELGLNQSLMEYFVSSDELDDYQKEMTIAHKRRTVLLVHNYRSHETLLDLPSRRFYGNKLIKSSKDATVEAICSWEELPNQINCPLLFFGVKGTQMRDVNSPSLSNPVEASTLVELLEKLVNSGRVTIDDIGVIAPYRAQVYKIRLLLRQKGLREIRVGTVDDYQGQEERVIFISTVLSFSSSTAMNLSSVGFMSSDQRFNVAITRAKSLLVVVGDPSVLMFDENWRSLLEYCVERKAYKGCPCPISVGGDDDDDIESAVKRMEDMILGPGDAAKMYPDEDDPEHMSAFFRDEVPFQVIL